MAKHRSYSIEFERQVAQEYIAAQFPVVLARVLQGNLLELFPRLRRSHLIGTMDHGPFGHRCSPVPALVAHLRTTISCGFDGLPHKLASHSNN